MICFSTCEWDSRFQRQQQLMLRFAAAGHRVFYVSQHFRRDGPGCAITGKHPNIREVTLRGEPLNVFTRSLRDRPRSLLMEGLDELRARASIDAAVMIVHLPFWWPLAREARDRFGWPVVYDCIDLHAGFSTVRKAMLAQEEDLLAAADLVIASSAILVGIRDVLHAMRPDVGRRARRNDQRVRGRAGGVLRGHRRRTRRGGSSQQDAFAPWPEEVNLKLLSVVTRFHFAPTHDARANLLREGTDRRAFTSPEARSSTRCTRRSRGSPPTTCCGRGSIPSFRFSTGGDS